MAYTSGEIFIGRLSDKYKVAESKHSNFLKKFISIIYVQIYFCQLYVCKSYNMFTQEKM